MRLAVFGQIDSHQGRLTVEERLGDGAGGFRLAHAGRAEQEKRRERPVTAKSRVAPPQRRSDSTASLVVPHHALVQAILEVAKTIVVITQKLAGRNRGRVGYHLGHAAFVNQVLAETGRAGRCDFGDG